MPPKQLNRTVFELLGVPRPHGYYPLPYRALNMTNETFFGHLPARRGAAVAAAAAPRRARLGTASEPRPGYGASHTVRSRTIPSGTCTKPRTCALINLYSFG